MPWYRTGAREDRAVAFLQRIEAVPELVGAVVADLRSDAEIGAQGHLLA